MKKKPLILTAACGSFRNPSFNFLIKTPYLFWSDRAADDPFPDPWLHVKILQASFRN
jgi:hypothetical protein